MGSPTHLTVFVHSSCARIGLRACNPGLNGSLAVSALHTVHMAAAAHLVTVVDVLFDETHSDLRELISACSE